MQGRATPTSINQSSVWFIFDEDMRIVGMRHPRTSPPSRAASRLTVLTLLGTLTACSMLATSVAAVASPTAQGSQPTGVVLDNSTNAASTSPSQTTGSNSSNGSSKGSGGSTGSTGAKIPKGLESFYRQKLTWTDCPDGATGTTFQCATVTVPLDYDHPQGKTITVALKKLPSTSSPLGARSSSTPEAPGEAVSPSSMPRPGSTRPAACRGSWRTMTSSASTRAALASPPPSPAGPPRTFRRLWTGGPRHPPS